MNARPSLGILFIASDDLGLAFRVTYHKAPDGPQLVLESEWYTRRK